MNRRTRRCIFICSLFLVYSYLSRQAPTKTFFAPAFVESVENRNFTSTELSSVRSIHDESGFVFVMFVDEDFLKMTLSWLCHAPTSVTLKTIFFVSSREVRKSLELFGAKHFKSLNSRLHRGKRKAKQYGQKTYYQLINDRARLVGQLLHHHLKVWIIESDSTWFADPTEVLVQFQDQDVIAGKDGEGKDEFPEAGFVFLNSTLRTRNLWDNMVIWQQRVIDEMEQDDVGDAGNEMLQLPEMLRQANCSWSYFPASNFVSGKWYLSWHIRSMSSPIVIQNNWIIGTKDKIRRAQQWGHWYLHPRGDTCLMTRESMPHQSIYLRR